MKKFSIASLLLASCLYFGISCTKEGVQVPVNPQNRASSCDEDYDNILNTAALGIINLSKNASFRSLVNQEVSLQFDGDDNVLFKKIGNEL